MSKTCQNQLLNMVLSNVYLLLVQLEPGLDVGRPGCWVGSVQQQESLQFSLCCL